MNKIIWNGELPERRYAFFSSWRHASGKYLVLITGNDLNTAEKWGGFVGWCGGVRPAETRKVN